MERIKLKCLYLSLFDARQKFVNFAVFLRFSLHCLKTKPQIEKMYSLRTKDIFSDYDGVYYCNFEGILIEL
jgi:hypothetical protein